MARHSKSPKKSKTAFVIMPFHELDSEAQQHFKQVYDSAILPVLENFGYTVATAENLGAESSNSRINRHLLQDDLVIVSLTRLNPGVFSKLSIRDKTARNKIILLVDEDYDPDPRFDTSRYPSIRYTERRDLVKTIKGDLATLLSRFNESKKDNTTLAALIKQTDKPANSDIRINPIDELSKAIVDSYNDRDPARIIKKAEEAISKTPQDLNTFLVDCVQEFINRESFTPTDRQYIQMEYLAKKVGLEGISFSLLEIARKLYPESKIVEYHYVFRYAQSTERSNRDHAKSVVIKKYEIKLRKSRASVGRPLRDPHDLYLISAMLDAMHTNQEPGENAAALAITKALSQQYPGASIIKRNYARAMEYSNRVSREEVLKIYQQAIFCMDVDSLSTKWFAITLKEAGKLVDVVEVMAFACMLNSDGSENFARLAFEMSNLIQPTNAFIAKQLDRQIPSECNKLNVVHATLLSETCDNYTKLEIDLCSQALRNIGVDKEERQDIYINLYKRGDISRPERSSFVKQLYNSLKSATTDPTMS